MKALQRQHDQVMRNQRSSQIVELRRALHNQSVDMTRHYHTEAEWLARGQLVVARDRALSELQDLQTAHAELQAKVSVQHACSISHSRAEGNIICAPDAEVARRDGLAAGDISSCIQTSEVACCVLPWRCSVCSVSWTYCC